MNELKNHLGKKERVVALRGKLFQQGLDGFIIPHADEYQNEYIPACAERLAWLTGFTGSAGTAVVLQDEAAIFVDGRYVIQVQNQVERSVFVPHHLTEWPVHEWLTSVLKPGQKLGFDPWLHTPNEVEKFRAACERAEAQLMPCELNPIDVIWSDRPEGSMNPVVPHSIQYSGKESGLKREELARKLKSDRVDAVVLTAPDSIAWLLNIRGRDVPHTPLPLSWAILHGDSSVKLFIDQPKVTSALVDHMKPGVSLSSPKEFGTVLDELGNQGIRFLYDPGKSPFWVWDRLSQAGATLVKGEDPCALPKACKNQVEVQGARQSHIRDGGAVCRFLAWLAREGPEGLVTELMAANVLESYRRDNELFRDLSFPTISGAGSNGAIVHYHSTEETNRRLEPGTLYLVDSGAQYVDGTTDITRTVAIGTPTAEHRDRYTRVLKGHIALATAHFPKGTTGSQLDALARQPLWEMGLDYDHGTGHGVGSYLGVHEGPQRISKSPNSVALQPGMIVSNEPGYYKAGEYGIRLENLVVVVDGSDKDAERSWLTLETLTVVPFDKHLIESSILTSKECDWLNNYHTRVYETLRPLLDQETTSWLRSATVPI
jgi:Xaa-Pro aminopeptidase